MPYPAVLQVIVEPFVEGIIPHTIFHPYMSTNLEELQKSWIQLKEERDTFETQFYASEKKLLELTKRLHKEQTLMHISTLRGSIHGRLESWFIPL